MKKRKVIKTGNSLALTIPFELISALDIKQGDLVFLSVDLANGRISYQFPSRPRQLSLSTK